MAADLAAGDSIQVLAVDHNPEALFRLKGFPSIRTEQNDLSDPEIVRDLAAEADFVINALPGFMGFQTLRAVIAAGVSLVDISFFPEDPFLLQEAAVKAGIAAVVDCGVAPGMSNLLVGHADSQLDATESVRIYVGGLPEAREWPFEYKAVFSPSDVLEEYIRPARFIRGGRMITRPALSEPEKLYFDHIGTLEAFNTDGLRTLAATIKAPDMIEKTLRYPGHAVFMAALRKAGFLSRSPIQLKETEVIPLEVTAHILSEEWRMKEKDRDITVMRIEVEGTKKGRRVRHTFELFDRFDESTGIHSMARTTGYTATAALRLLAEGRLPEKGIIPPEWIGRRPDCVEYMLEGLAERGVTYTSRVEVDPPESQIN
jgi:saccharopine dehydrogenase-like NADP-dependent oxidoreductase